MVAFAVSPEVAFDYLADPHHRAEWQASLARVEDVDGDVGVGQTWVDVTRPGLRPRLETIEVERPRRWSEHGTWRGIDATVTLTFVGTPSGCEVTATTSFRGSGWWALPARAVALVAPIGVRCDLRHAASTFSA